MPTPLLMMRRRRDDGSVLPMVLVMMVVVSLVVVSLTNYIATDLRYGHVVEERADRLAAADGGLRYAIEELQNSQYAMCLTQLGLGGTSIEFPAKVNDADVTVTCRKGGGSIADIKAWALIVTGEGVPSGQFFAHSTAGAGVQKLLGGPIWVSDPDRMVLDAPITIEDGDIFHYSADCDNRILAPQPNLTFTPAFRGTHCESSTWQQIYKAPPIGSVPNVVNPAPDTTTYPGCRVFSPGRYTSMPSLGNNNYFRSGNYYLDDFKFEIKQAIVTAGWADFPSYGDQLFVPNDPCNGAMNADAGNPGATFYMGGDARFEIDVQGSLEIMRRLQGDDLVSIQTLETPTSGMSASTLGWNDNVIFTKGGNNSDLAIHGLVWAPEAQMEFGNVTNSANGQLLGGAALARVILQGSASVSNFIIRVESSPIDHELRIDSTATKNDRSTTMTAVVQIDDKGTANVTSIRVRDV